MAIFGQFTKRAQQVLMTAQECATREGQPYVGTLHFLYGLLDVGEAPESVTRHIQKEDVKQVLDQIDDEVSLHPGHGPVQMTPRARRVLDGSIGDDFLAMLDQMDLVGLSWFDAGVRSFYTREKVTDLEQLQGLTLRVQESDMMSEMITDLGAEPVQVVYSQVYAALRNGQIDGAENNWPSYDAMGHYEVAPYFLQDEHTRVPEIQLASTAAIEKLEALDPSYPEVLRTCARESARTERRLWAEREARSEKELREWGVEVTTLPDAEKQKFRAAVQPLYDRFADQAELLERIKES